MTSSGRIRRRKFHAWCEIDRDLELCRAVHERFRGSGMQLMLDVEQRYSRLDALRAARELETMGFRWFEAPLPDTDLEGYRELRRRVGIPILPAGNWVLDPRLIALGIGMGCWSAVRVDATVAGGITPTARSWGSRTRTGSTPSSSAGGTR
jgi:L-alanine-DL-glutamate epimerase-like enolase superfamily enzyme